MFTRLRDFHVPIAQQKKVVGTGMAGNNVTLPALVPQVDPLLAKLKNVWVTSFVTLSLLLLCGHCLRSRFLWLRALHLPASLVGGLVGWVFFALTELCGYDELASEWIYASWGKLPGFCTNMVFCCLFLGTPVPAANEVLQSPRREHLVYGLTVVWGQYIVSAVVTSFCRLFDPTLSPVFATILPYGYAGGPVVAEAMRPLYAPDSFNYPEGYPLALLAAAVGMFAGVIVGAVLVNLAPITSRSQVRSALEDVDAESAGVASDSTRPASCMRSASPAAAAAAATATPATPATPPPSPPTAEAPPELAIGGSYTVAGLLQRSDLNGKKARVVAHDAAKGLWHVMIDGEANKVALRPQNLQLNLQLNLQQNLQAPPVVSRTAPPAGAGGGGASSIVISTSSTSSSSSIAVGVFSRRQMARITRALVDLKRTASTTDHYPPNRRPQSGEQTVSSESIDSLMFHVCLVASVMFLGYLMRIPLVLIEQAFPSDSFMGRSRLLSVLPLFLFCLLGGLLIQSVIDRKYTDAHTGKSFVDRNTIMSISNTAQDILIVAAVSLLGRSGLPPGVHGLGSFFHTVFTSGVPLMMVLIMGIVWGVLSFWYLAPRLLPDFWAERALVEVGVSIGATSTGLLLLRMADPENRTPVLRDFTFKQIFHVLITGGGFFDVLVPIPLTSSTGSELPLLLVMVLMVALTLACHPKAGRALRSCALALERRQWNAQRRVAGAAVASVGAAAAAPAPSAAPCGNVLNGALPAVGNTAAAPKASSSGVGVKTATPCTSSARLRTGELVIDTPLHERYEAI
jgi:Na+/glutamate symporter